MSMETAIEKLADAIRYHADKTGPVAISVSMIEPEAAAEVEKPAPKKTRSRAKKKADPVETEVETVEETAADVGDDVETGTDETEPDEAPVELTSVEVQQKLIDLSARKGRGAAKEVLKQFNATGMKDLKPELYPNVANAADERMAA